MHGADVTTDDLWLHYDGVGGDLDAFELDIYLNGVYVLPVRDRTLIAAALNELIDQLPQCPRAEYEKIPRPDVRDLPADRQHLIARMKVVRGRRRRATYAMTDWLRPLFFAR